MERNACYCCHGPSCEFATIQVSPPWAACKSIFHTEGMRLIVAPWKENRLEACSSLITCLDYSDVYSSFETRTHRALNRPIGSVREKCDTVVMLVVTAVAFYHGRPPRHRDCRARLCLESCRVAQGHPPQRIRQEYLSPARHSLLFASATTSPVSSTRQSDPDEVHLKFDRARIMDYPPRKRLKRSRLVIKIEAGGSIVATQQEFATNCFDARKEPGCYICWRTDSSNRHEPSPRRAFLQLPFQQP